MENKTEKVKELRARTNIGMTDCTKALNESNGDVEKAIEILQKKNLIKKAESAVTLTEGLVQAAVLSDGLGSIIEMNCQTDFASKNEMFKEFVISCLGKPVDEIDYTLIHNQLREVVALRKTEHHFISNSKAFAYNHFNGKIAVLLWLETTSYDTLLTEFADDLAMHIAAAAPLAIYRDSVDEEVVLRQRAIFEAQLRADPKPKPEAMMTKIITGKMDKWFAETVLLEQESLVHPKMTIEGLRAMLEARVSTTVKIRHFIRYELGK